MTATTHHVLILAPTETAQVVHDALDDLPELFFIHAETTAEALAHIGARSLAFIVMDPSLPDLDAASVTAGLTGLPQTRMPPLLLITDDHERPDLYNQVPPLLIDHVIKPLDSILIRAKLLFFSAFFRHRIAMEQSIQELEKVYDRFMEQHQAVLSQISAKKELLASLSTFINQVYPFVSRIQGATFFLRQAPDLPQRLHPSVTQIRTAGEQMARTIQNLRRFRNRETAQPDLFTDRNGQIRPGRILFATPFSDEFMIVRHQLNNRIKADLFQAESTDQAMAVAADVRPDLILIHHRLNDGSGLHLLEKLARLKTRAPVIFTVDRNHTDADRARILAERIRLHIFEHQMQIGTRLLQLTVSIGTASFKGDSAPDDQALTLPALVQQAIHALDRAVKQGGNQIQS